MIPQVRYNLARILADAVQDGLVAQGDQLAAIAYVFESPRRDTARRTQLFRDVGQVSQNAVVNAYDEMVVGRERAASRTHYRAGATGPNRGRFANGVLRRALNSENFFEAHSDGLRFINTQYLDQRAMHWRRLAFGAEPLGRGARESFPVRFGSLVAGALGLDEPPSPAFDLPPGSFLAGERAVGHATRNRGRHAFYPRGELPPGTRLRGGQRATRGIAGRPFLQAGLQTMAETLPRAFEDYYFELFQLAQSRRGPIGRLPRARRPVPRSFS